MPFGAQYTSYMALRVLVLSDNGLPWLIMAFPTLHWLVETPVVSSPCCPSIHLWKKADRGGTTQISSTRTTQHSTYNADNGFQSSLICHFTPMTACQPQAEQSDYFCVSPDTYRRALVLPLSS
jgi:hypothetical protein